MVKTALRICHAVRPSGQSHVHPRRFGTPRALVSGRAASARHRAPIGDDLQLFATTFAAGFVFVTVLLA